MALVDELVQKITIKADTKALDVVQKKEQKLVATTNTLSASLKSAFRWLGGGLLLKSVVDASITMDGLNRSFEAIAGSAELGAEQIKYLRNEAERLGQDFRLISGAYKSFFAVGKGAGMSSQETQGIFSSVLEASTVLGSSAQSTEGALVALEQMISKGKVSMQELRGQLGNALPGAMQIAAKAFGVTTSELEKMVSAGLDSQEFVTKFSAELRKNYSGDKLTGPVKSLRAEFARLKNAIFDLESGFLSGQTGESFAEVIRAITKTLSSEGFRTSLKVIASILKRILDNARLIFYYVVMFKTMKLLKQFQLLGVFMGEFNKELAMTGNLFWSMDGALKATIMKFLTLTKSSLLFAKNVALALGVLLLAEDLIASLFPGTKTATKDAGNKLADFMTPKKDDSVWKKILQNAVKYDPGVLGMGFRSGQGIASISNMFSGGSSGTVEVAIPQQTPNITINQNIATGASPDEIAERTKQTLTGMFTQYSMGGV